MSDLTMWAQMGIELRQHGWGPGRVAEHINVSKSAVKNWFNHGAIPLYPSGDRLISLHRRVVLMRAVVVKPAWQSANCL
jgi:hypothetical protein